MQTGQLYPTASPYGFGQTSTIEFTTDPLLSGDTLDISLGTAKSYQVLSVTTNYPAWVRVYGSAYGRDIDTRTQPGAPFPDQGSGFFLEVQTYGEYLEAFLSPTAEVQTETGETFLRIRNDSGSTAAITVSLQISIGSYAEPPTNPPYGCNVFVNTAGQTDLTNAWKDCTSITQLPLLNLSEALTLESAWENCANLTFVPQGLFDNCPGVDLTNAFVNCRLSTESVDNVLVSLDTAGGVSGTVDITGGGNYPPSATGLAAKLSLEGKGWTVNIVPSSSPSSVDLGGSEVVYSMTSFGDGRVFVGTDTGYVFASADYGATFDAGTAVGAGTIRSIAACNADTVIAGTWDNSFYFITTDGGATWGAGEDFAEAEIDSVAHAGSGVIYIGTYGYIHKSTDNGTTWLPGYEPKVSGDYYQPIVFPGPNKVLAGTYGDGYFAYSFDGGSTWSYTANGILDGLTATINGLASDGAGTVLAGTVSDGRVFKSVDSGVTWDTGIQLGAATAVDSIVYAGFGVFFAGTDDGGKIYRSSDWGSTWEEFFDPAMPSFSVYSLTLSGNGYLLAGIGTLVYSIPLTYAPLPSPIPTQIYPVFSEPNLTTNAVVSNVTGITGASQITNMVSISQADYNNIVTPDPQTLYIITS